MNSSCSEIFRIDLDKNLSIRCGNTNIKRLLQNLRGYVQFINRCPNLHLPCSIKIKEYVAKSVLTRVESEIYTTIVPVRFNRFGCHHQVLQNSIIKNQ
jgi:hypothetical protein